jgi:hypothetical protein
MGIEGDPSQDAYISFARLEPWGTIYGVAADYAEVSGYIDENGADELAAKIAISISRNITSKTFLAGLSNVAMAASDPDRYGERYIQRLLGTVVPTGLSQIARVNDPILREVRSTLDQIKSRIAGQSKTLPARRNWRGEPIMTDPGYGPDIFSPLFTNRAEPDPASQEMYRLRIGPKMPQRKIAGVELTPKEYTRLQKETGIVAGRTIDLIINAPYYNALPDGIRKELIEKAYRKAKEHGRQKVLSEISPERRAAPRLEKLAPFIQQ